MGRKNMAKRKIKKGKKFMSKKKDAEGLSLSITSRQEKQIKLAVIFMLCLIGVVLFSYYLVQKAKKFEYAGLEFEKTQQGNMLWYKTKFPLKSSVTGSVVSHLAFNFKEDPKKLSRIDIDGKIRLKENVALAINGEDIENCEDAILAGTTLSVSFFGRLGIKAFGATTNKTEAELLNRIYVNCNDTSDYSIIDFKKGNATKIIRKGDCYKLQYANCEIMNVTERFIIGLWAHSRGIEV